MKVFVLTGAGVSAESGIGTFRDKGGLWTTRDPAALATPEAFARDPDAVQAFYNARRARVLQAQPNAAHVALARLEAGLAAQGGALTLVTQNVDDLHERAGSRKVVHMHGELLKARCARCRGVHPWREDLGGGDACPTCGQAGGLRPHVVWFGEMPLHMARIEAALAAADLFAAIGTSGAVYPAAGFVTAARAAGVRSCELNLEASDNAAAFDEHHYGAASAVVPVWVDRLLAGGEHAGVS